jgi:hypothetical protein
MKSVLPLLSLVLLFASCTTAYKSGQTPDDVYFSPQRPQDEYVRVENKKEKYRYDEQNDDDRYLRMRVRNRRMWSDLDYYYSDPYAYRYFNNGYNPYIYNPYAYSNPWSSYSYWNHYYNPYSTNVIVVNPKSPVYNKPRISNLRVYDDPQSGTINNNPKVSNGGRVRVFGSNNDGNNYNESRRNSGSDLRTIFGNSNSSRNSNSSSDNAPVRTQSSTSNSSNNSSSSSSGSTNAPVRKF